jgi:hypothetical protein
MHRHTTRRALHTIVQALAPTATIYRACSRGTGGLHPYLTLLLQVKHLVVKFLMKKHQLDRKQAKALCKEALKPGR